MKLLKKHLIIAICSVLLSTGTIFADQTIDSLVVTATRTEHSVQEVSSAVEIITADDIKRRGAKQITDMLEFCTGLMTQDSSAVSIRGFETDHTLILINGKRITGGFGAKKDLNRIDINNIERIEILRGSAGALYGSDALGGVINIITEKKLKRFCASVDTQYGNFNGDGEQKHLNLSVGGPITQKLNIAGYGTTRNYDRLDGESGDSIQRDGKINTGGVELNYTVNDTDEIGISFEKMIDQGDNFSRHNTLKHIDDNKRNAYSIYWSGHHAGYEGRARFYSSTYEKHYENHSSKKHKLTSFIDSERTDSILDGQLSISTIQNHLITAGMELKRQSYEGTGVLTDDIVSTGVYKGVPYRKSKSEIDYYGFFIQDEWWMNDSLYFNASARYDGSNEFEDDISPKMGLIYRISNDLRVKANYSHGFKAPNPGDLWKRIVKSKKKKIFVGNPDVDSEKSNTYELSVEGEYGLLSAKTSAFYSRIDGLIEKVFTGKKDTTTGYSIYSYENISDATIQGLEFQASYQMFSQASLHFNYTYLDAKGDIIIGKGRKAFTNNKRLTNRSRHVANLRFSYDYLPWGMTVNVSGKYVGNSLLNYERNSANYITGENTKNYVLCYINLSKELHNGLDIYAGIDNIFDKKDEDIPLYGMHSYIGLRYKF